MQQIGRINRTEALQELVAFEEFLLDVKSSEQRLALFLTTTQYSEPDRSVQQLIREVFKTQSVLLKDLLEGMQKHLDQEESRHPDVVAVEVSGVASGVPTPKLGDAAAVEDPMIQFNELPPLSTFR